MPRKLFVAKKDKKLLGKVDIIIKKEKMLLGTVDNDDVGDDNDLSWRSIINVAGHRGKRVPDARPLATLACSPLNLNKIVQEVMKFDHLVE